MKKLFFFASAMIAALSMNAQTTTITIDGDPAEWAEIPMITEPGNNDAVLKYALTQDGVSVGADNAYAVLATTVHAITGSEPVTIYVDADKSSATGQQIPWFITSMYRDYEMGITDGGDGITGAVRVTDAQAGVIELSMPESAFTTVPFVGNFWGYFSYNWGNFYIPNSPTDDAWLWSQNFYQPTDVRPFAYTALAGTHAFADTWSRHQCIALGDSMNFNVSGGAQDTAFWCAWTVEITAGAKYDVTAGVTSDNSATVNLYLVDVATNTTVASLASDTIWAPEGSMAVGEWDLSTIPAGKYMLKAKNSVAWSHMKLASVTLTAKPGPGTSVSEVAAPAAKVQKQLINGRMIIKREGQNFSAQGQRL